MRRPTDKRAWQSSRPPSPRLSGAAFESTVSATLTATSRDFQVGLHCCGTISSTPLERDLLGFGGRAQEETLSRSLAPESEEQSSEPLPVSVMCTENVLLAKWCFPDHTDSRETPDTWRWGGAFSPVLGTGRTRGGGQHGLASVTPGLNRCSWLACLQP